jgi:hypothetical protein
VLAVFGDQPSRATKLCGCLSGLVYPADDALSGSGTTRTPYDITKSYHAARDIRTRFSFYDKILPIGDMDIAAVRHSE